MLMLRIVLQFFFSLRCSTKTKLHESDSNGRLSVSLRFIIQRKWCFDELLQHKFHINVLKGLLIMWQISINASPLAIDYMSIISSWVYIRLDILHFYELFISSVWRFGLQVSKKGKGRERRCKHKPHGRIHLATTRTIKEKKVK